LWLPFESAAVMLCFTFRPETRARLWLPFQPAALMLDLTLRPEARARLWLPFQPAALMLDLTLRPLFVVVFMSIPPLLPSLSDVLTVRTQRPCASGVPSARLVV